MVHGIGDNLQNWSGLSKANSWNVGTTTCTTSDKMGPGLPEENLYEESTLSTLITTSWRKGWKSTKNQEATARATCAQIPRKSQCAMDTKDVIPMPPADGDKDAGLAAYLPSTPSREPSVKAFFGVYQIFKLIVYRFCLTVVI